MFSTPLLSFSEGLNKLDGERSWIEAARPSHSLGFGRDVNFLRSTWSSGQSNLLQKRRGPSDSLPIDRIQLLDPDVIEVAECAMQPVARCVSLIHDVRLRRLLAQKNEAGVLMPPTKVLHQA